MTSQIYVLVLTCVLQIKKSSSVWVTYNLHTYILYIYTCCFVSHLREKAECNTHLATCFKHNVTFEVCFQNYIWCKPPCLLLGSKILNILVSTRYMALIFSLIAGTRDTQSQTELFFYCTIYGTVMASTYIASNLKIITEIGSKTSEESV